MEPFELYILNEDFEQVCYIDTFESMIWTDRYRQCGDFELYVSTQSTVLVYAVHGYYIWVAESDRLMIIEQTEITTDVETGPKLKITGRSLESILDRRIIWSQITVKGKVDTVIKRLITDAIISPSINDRKIPNFIYKDATDPYIADCEVEETQYLGDNLYDVVCDIVSVFNIGFKIIYNFDTGNFEFSLYCGNNRSYDQDVLPWVIFSPAFDNIVSSDFIEDSTPYKNINLVYGEEREGYTRQTVVIDATNEDENGLNRREMFTDGSSKQQVYTEEDGTEVTLTDAQYVNVLRELGVQELNLPEHQLTKSFDGEMNSARGFKYGVDFFLGDAVQLENEYGMKATARVIEMILSQSASGIESYPTFEAIR